MKRRPNEATPSRPTALGKRDGVRAKRLNERQRLDRGGEHLSGSEAYLAISSKIARTSAKITLKSAKTKPVEPSVGSDLAPRLVAWFETHGRKNLPWQHP